MILAEIAKQTKKLVPLSQRMDSTDLAFDDISMLLELLKHCSICRSQKVDSRLKGLPRQATDRKMDIPTKNYGSVNSNISSGRSSATYHTSRLGQLSFLNIPFSAILPPPIDV